MQHLRILMLEDVEEDAGLVDRVLHKEKILYNRIRVDTREEFIDALDTFVPDVILSDHSLPQFNSIEALNICNARKVKIPFILVTGSVSEEFAVNCLKNGADDYILKTNLSRLPLAIRYAIRRSQYEVNRRRQEEKVQRQNEELQKVNQELDAFVYSVSHNIRSPLTSVLGIINVLKLEPPTTMDGFQRYLDMIQQSVLKLDSTLKDIIEFSRNVHEPLSVEIVDSRVLIESIFERVKHYNGFGRIKKEIIVDADILFYSDWIRLRTVLTNIISNSIQYSDDTKLISWIKIKVIVTPFNATIVIEDNGIGIQADQMDNIFKMFYRATERSQGAGLGLYIVKEMLEKLQGKIHVDAETGVGTIVTLTVPNRLSVTE